MTSVVDALLNPNKQTTKNIVNVSCKVNFDFL